MHCVQFVEVVFEIWTHYNHKDSMALVGQFTSVVKKWENFCAVVTVTVFLDFLNFGHFHSSNS